MQYAVKKLGQKDQKFVAPPANRYQKKWCNCSMCTREYLATNRVCGIRKELGLCSECYIDLIRIIKKYYNLTKLKS